MSIRVIVWGTGFVGKMVIEEILDHPDYELAGVIVHDPAKDGRDVGDGGGPARARRAAGGAAELRAAPDGVIPQDARRSRHALSWSTVFEARNGR